MELGREHRNQEPVLKAAREEAEQFLTLQGYKGTELLVPQEWVMTKVFVLKYSPTLGPDFLVCLDEEACATRRGAMPSRCHHERKSPGGAHIWGGIRVEPPALCLKCSWRGHIYLTCHQDARCRFCGREHDSRISRVKTNKGERVKPSSCNCRGSHNAGFLACKTRVKMEIIFSIPSKETEEKQEE